MSDVVFDFCQDNACFCLAIAHFYSARLSYPNRFMTALAECFSDVFAPETAGEDEFSGCDTDADYSTADSEHFPERGGSAKTDADCRAKADSEENAKPDADCLAKTDSESKAKTDAGSLAKSEAEPGVKAEAESHTSTSEAEPKPDMRQATESPPASASAPKSSPATRQPPMPAIDVSAVSDFFTSAADRDNLPHAWWENFESCPTLMNPAAALHIWREHCWKAPPLPSQPLPVIWPSKSLLTKWEEYCNALDELVEPQAQQILLVFQGCIADTAKAVDTVAQTTLYPQYPNLHRGRKPYDPYGALQGEPI
jgi:hypothetical protein